MARFLVLLAMILLAGCTQTKTVYIDRPFEVLVPVPTSPVAPAWLATPYVPEAIPQFTHPKDPTAHAALTQGGLTDLKVLLRTLVERDRAWREWATAPSVTDDPETPDVQPE